MVMSSKSPQGVRLNPQNTLELSQGMSIQDAIDTADAHGGNWTIMLYPGANYNEGDLTPSGAANITIKGMGEERVVIAPTAAPVTAVIVSAGTLNLENLVVTAPDATRPAAAVTGGVLTLNNCNISGVGVGDALAMTGGTAILDDCRVPVGDINLDTDDCTLTMRDSYMVADGIDTAGAFAHVITLINCSFGNRNIVSAATGATTITIENCTAIGTVSNAGTGNFTVRNSDIDTVTTSSTGEIEAFGGYIGACGGATASIVWWENSQRIKVLANMRIADAIAAAAAGTIIQLIGGTYNETNMTLKDGVDIVGHGSTITIIADNSANTIFTGGNVTCTLKDLRIDHSGGGAGACLAVNNAGADINLDDVDIVGVATPTNAIVMTAGALTCETVDVLAGDIDLSTAACTLTMVNCTIANGDIDTAGAFAHVINLTYCALNNRTLANAATGATTITLRYCSGMLAFTDASLVGTVLIEDTTILTATKTGTSPWTIQLARIGALSNNNATGAVTVYGGYINTCGGSTGSILWYLPDSREWRCIAGMNPVDFMAAIASGDTIRFGAGAFALAAQLARAIDDVKLIGSGLGTRFTLDGVTAVISAGTQDGWLLADFDVDAGLVDIQNATHSTLHNITVNGLFGTITNPDLGRTNFPGQPVMRLEEIRPLDPTATVIIRDYSRKEYQVYNPTFATPEFIMELLDRQARTVVVPINSLWTDNSGGTGSSSLEPQQARVICAAAGGDHGLVYCTAAFLTSSFSAGNHDRVDFNNKLIFSFDVSRDAGTHADLRGRVQLKQANGEGILAADGLGIEIQNYAIYGEVFNAARGTVTLNTTMTAQYAYRIRIELTPGVSVAFYVNDQLKATYTTVANIPSGLAAAQTYWVISMDNAAQAVACELRCSPILVHNHL